MAFGRLAGLCFFCKCRAKPGYDTPAKYKSSASAQRYALTLKQLSYALPAQHDSEFLFHIKMFASRKAEDFYDLLTVAPLASGVLSHLHSLVVRMYQHPFVTEAT